MLRVRSSVTCARHVLHATIQPIVTCSHLTRPFHRCLTVRPHSLVSAQKPVHTNHATARPSSIHDQVAHEATESIENVNTLPEESTHEEDEEESTDYELPSYPKAFTSHLFLTAPHPNPKLSKNSVTHMNLLTQAGLIRHARDQTMLLPLGSRVLSKLNRLLDRELEQFHPQTIETLDNNTTYDIDQYASFSTVTPYSPSLANSIPQMTNLIADDFRSGGLTEASLRTQALHLATPTNVENASLWTTMKRTEEIGLYDRKHARGLERYHSLVDAFRHAAVHATGSIKQVHVVDTKADRSGLAGVDGDLAHEIHVEVNKGDSGGSHLLGCTKCKYSAKPTRAISIPSPSTSTTIKSSSTQQAIPSPVQDATKKFARELVSQHFSGYVLDQLKLDDPTTPWTVQFMYSEASQRDDGTTPSTPKLLYVVLMRTDHTPNLDAISEHVSEPFLQLAHLNEIIDFLHQQPNADDSLLKFKSQDTSSDLLSSTIFDPELLIDQTLIPENLDLDLDVIEGEEDPADAEGETVEDVDDADTVDPDTLDKSDPVLLSRFEKHLASDLGKLEAGEGIDLVQVEMKAKGLDPQQAKARLYEEAVTQQKGQHEEKLKQENEQARVEKLKKVIDEDSDAAPVYDPTLDPTTADPSTIDPIASAALIPHFEYSRQGFFHLASEGETCAICRAGQLKSIQTHIIANTTFIGRQELVRAEDEEEEVKPIVPLGSKKNKPKPKKKQFLHTSFGRFSVYDLFTHLAVKHFSIPPPPPANTQPNPLTSVSAVHFPPLIAPYQVVLIPVTQEPVPTNPRDLGRTSSLTTKEKEEAADIVIQTCEEFHDELIEVSKAHHDRFGAGTVTLNESVETPMEFHFSSLEGEILINDHYAEHTALRIHHAISLGVPIILLLSAQSIKKGYVNLILNKRGLKVEMRKVGIEGLATLIQRMVESNYSHMIQLQQQLQKEQLQQKRMKDELDRLANSGAENFEFQR